jgi:hypothetical protein
VISLFKKRTETKSPYQRLGYKNRWDYLRRLSKEYKVSYRDVASLAEMLGSAEDFDGLLTELEYIQLWSGDDI